MTQSSHRRTGAERLTYCTIAGLGDESTMPCLQWGIKPTMGEQHSSSECTGRSASSERVTHIPERMVHDIAGSRRRRQEEAWSHGRSWSSDAQQKVGSRAGRVSCNGDDEDPDGGGAHAPAVGGVARASFTPLLNE
jgi:hypothetical protein